MGGSRASSNLQIWRSNVLLDICTIHERQIDGIRDVGSRQDDDILCLFQLIDLGEDGIDHLEVAAHNREQSKQLIENLRKGRSIQDEGTQWEQEQTRMASEGSDPDIAAFRAAVKLSTSSAKFVVTAQDTKHSTMEE